MRTLARYLALHRPASDRATEAPAPEFDRPRRVDVLGTGFDAVSAEQAVECIRSALRSGRHMQIVPGNVDFVMKARRDETFREELGNADLVVADGVPIVWAASMLGTPLRSRVSGTALVQACAAVSAELDSPVALVGAAPGVADRAAAVMSAESPGSRLHAVPTPFPLDEDGSRKVVAAVRDSGAGIVLAALGAPLQERWVAENLEATGASVGIGVGSAFDIISGDKPRAPGWMCDLGLEWLHRMVQDPKRLARRYLIEDSPFVAHLVGAVLTRHLSRAPKGGRSQDLTYPSRASSSESRGGKIRLLSGEAERGRRT